MARRHRHRQPVQNRGILNELNSPVSSTPLQYIVDYCALADCLLVFQIDLFSARGQTPLTLLDVAQREKDIRYSSRTRLNTDLLKRGHDLRHVIKRLSAKISAKLKDDCDWRALSGLGDVAGLTIVQLVHRRAAYETLSKDFNFSRAIMEDHWKAGVADVQATLAHPDWLSRRRPDEDVGVLDCTRELDKGI